MPKIFDKMVQDIKANGGADNPFAVARAKLGSNAQIAARAKGKAKMPMAKGKKKMASYG